MKIEVEKTAASRLINCGELILVTAGHKDKVTITPCAWHMPISKSPAALGVALAKKHFSSELIKKSGEFAINIPDWPLLDRVIDCGKCSGREVDKFKKINLTKVKGCAISKAPLVGECIGNIECTLLDIKDVGDHFIFIGEILSFVWF